MKLQNLKPRIAWAETQRVVTARQPTGSWRDGKTTAERGYGWRWQKARQAYLAEHPLCVMCAADSRVTAAEVVDHITPHEGNQALFWDSQNWQPLCKWHHDSVKQALEKSGTPGGR